MKKKSVKMRGQGTHGYGSKKKHRGAGSRGGVGYGGSFKQKRVYLRLKEPGHFQKRKFKSLKGKGIKKPLKPLNLRDIPVGGGEFPGVKILAAGRAPKAAVKASAFSARAKEKIEKAGGKAETI